MSLFDFFRKRSSVAPGEVVNPPTDRRRRARAQVPPGTSVLIVDDSKTMVAALGRMLRDNHFEIFEALDGESALEVLRKNKPNLIFLDIILPGINGFEVLRRIRR